MTDHAQQLVDFYKALTEGGVSSEVAGVCTIDLNKGIVAGSVKPAPPSPVQVAEEKRSAIAAAAEEKRAVRAAQLEGQP